MVQVNFKDYAEFQEKLWDLRDPGPDESVTLLKTAMECIDKMMHIVSDLHLKGSIIAEDQKVTFELDSKNPFKEGLIRSTIYGVNPMMVAHFLCEVQEPMIDLELILEFPAKFHPFQKIYIMEQVNILRGLNKCSDNQFVLIANKLK